MNADALLIRTPSTSHGTFGMLRAGRFVSYSGELAWHENKPMISCILPAPGDVSFYDLYWGWSPSFKRNVYRFAQVPERSGVLKHAANLMGDVAMGLVSQLNGCIALGERLGRMRGQKALLLSAPAVRAFAEYMGFKPFRLEIRWASS